jgi:malonate transporter
LVDADFGARNRYKCPLWRLLIAFFGGCLIVFAIGRLLARSLFGLDGVSQSVFALDMSLAGYSVRAGMRQSAIIVAVKLLVQPLVVWSLARLLDLPLLETQVVVLLASLAVGANVYLMSRQFDVLEGPVAAALVVSTALSAVTTPLALALATAAA